MAGPNKGSDKDVAGRQITSGGALISTPNGVKGSLNITPTTLGLGINTFPTPSSPVIKQWGATIDRTTGQGAGVVVSISPGSTPVSLGTAVAIFVAGPCPNCQVRPSTAQDGCTDIGGVACDNEGFACTTQDGKLGLCRTSVGDGFHSLRCYCGCIPL